MWFQCKGHELCGKGFLEDVRRKGGHELFGKKTQVVRGLMVGTRTPVLTMCT